MYTMAGLLMWFSNKKTHVVHHSPHTDHFLWHCEWLVVPQLHSGYISESGPHTYRCTGQIHFQSLWNWWYGLQIMAKTTLFLLSHSCREARIWLSMACTQASLSSWFWVSKCQLCPVLDMMIKSAFSSSARSKQYLFTREEEIDGKHSPNLSD